MEKSTDKELMNLVLKKNSRAFQILYQRYEMAIFNFIFRYTSSREIAQDLLQETFTRVWFAAHLFDYKGGNFRGWLYTIALNTTRNEMSKKRYTYQYLDVSEIKGKQEPVHPENERPDSKMENLDLKEKIEQALENLKPHFREIIILKHFQQLKFREIAEITKTPESTLKARFHRGIEQLKKHLEPMEFSDAA